MPKQRELIAKFLGERRAFENGDESRVIIGDAEVDGEPVTIKGDAAENSLAPGMTYRFYGHENTHAKYGKQFAFANFVAEQPADQDGIVAYLQQCKGIGPATAYLLWDNFGPDAVRKLREDPEEAREGIPRFTSQVAEQASVFLQSHERTEKVKIELIGLFNGRGFSKKLVGLVIEHFGTKAAETIRKNPYQLMKFKGCGFLRSDKMYLDLGGNPSRLKRQALCLWHGVRSLANGDTWIPMNEARDCLVKNIAGSSLRFDKAMDLALRADILQARTENGRCWVAEKGNAFKEERIAEWLEEARNERALLWPVGTEIKGLSPHQQRELAGALQGVVCVLAGRPGTGKTYTSAALIKHIQGSGRIAACAPTGKAAVRLTEALQDNGVDITATTIHRLLGVNSSDGGWSFVHGPTNPLPHSFIFVDEASMLDTDIMYSLLAARAPGTHIIFVGDTNQLPPVGHGAPLRDFIMAGVPHGQLTEIQRNSGQIVKTCAEIVEKRRFSASERIDVEEGMNLKVAAFHSPESQIQCLLDSLPILERRWGVDPVWGCQVLVAVNAKSPLARKTLNVTLQDLLNPHGKQVKGSPFRRGDKIICTKNKEFPEIDARNGETQFVANGEMGEVIEVEEKRTMVRLTSPDRMIIVPRGTNDDAEDGEESTGTGCDWELGYAISVHKSQGSEWPIVFVMLDEYSGARMVMSRQWLYTAISRAKLFCVCIGKKNVADGCCQRDSLFKRKTFLRELILEPQQAVFDDLFAEVV